jgi:hypothetical protein
VDPLGLEMNKKESNEYDKLLKKKNKDKLVDKIKDRLKFDKKAEKEFAKSQKNKIPTEKETFDDFKGRLNPVQNKSKKLWKKAPLNVFF